MRLPIALLMMSLAGCGRPNAGQQGGRWEYEPARGAYEARLKYVDAEGKVAFFGLCDGGPAYILKSGEYADASQFALTVDGTTWTLPINYHAHGRMLMVDRYEQQSAIAHAKKQILFQIGDWKEEIRPSPELASFARDCPLR